MMMTMMMMMITMMILMMMVMTMMILKMMMVMMMMMMILTCLHPSAPSQSPSWPSAIGDSENICFWRRIHFLDFLGNGFWKKKKNIFKYFAQNENSTPSQSSQIMCSFFLLFLCVMIYVKHFTSGGAGSGAHNPRYARYLSKGICHDCLKVFFIIVQMVFVMIVWRFLS